MAGVEDEDYSWLDTLADMVAEKERQDKASLSVITSKLFQLN